MLTNQRFKSARTLDDQAFLACFNELDSGLPASLEHVFEHFERRAQTVDQLELQRSTELTPDSLLQSADALVERRFVFSGWEPVVFAAQVDWGFEPTGDPRRRWCRELNRHQWLQTLVHAYAVSADPKYLRVCSEFMLSWIDRCPPPRDRNEGDPAWSLMSVGMRCMVWPAAFFASLRAGVLRRDEQLSVLRALLDHGMFLMLHQTHGNHLLRESNGLANLAAWLPEFRASSRWRDTALRRLAREARLQVNRDGSHVEMSPAYQWLVAEELEASLGILQRAGWQLPGVDLEATLKRLYSALVGMRLPNGNWPQLNDGFFEPWEQHETRLRLAAERFRMPGLLEPPCRSSWLPDAGLAVMRDGPSSCLVFKAGPYGGMHGHEDKLSVEVHVEGDPVIVDPGTYTYNAKDPYRSHFVSSQSHNTVVVDGQSQVRRWFRNHQRLRAGPAPDFRWVVEPEFELASGRYDDGYGCFQLYAPRSPGKLVDRSVSHERTVLAVRSAYWLIVDLLDTTGVHEYVRGFQCAEGVDLSLHGQRARLAAGAGGLVVAWAESDTQATVNRGEPPPHGGWTSNGAVGHKVAASRLSLSGAGHGRTLLATLLVPVSGQGPARYEYLEAAEQEGGALHLRVSGTGTRDDLRMADFSSSSSSPLSMALERTVGDSTSRIVEYGG